MSVVAPTVVLPNASLNLKPVAAINRIPGINAAPTLIKMSCSCVSVSSVLIPRV